MTDKVGVFLHLLKEEIVDAVTLRPHAVSGRIFPIVEQSKDLSIAGKRLAASKVDVPFILTQFAALGKVR